MTITEFLLARIAEDEKRACLAAARGIAWVGLANKVAISHVQAGWHVLRWRPARVLAECEAKRRAIDAAWSDHERIEGEWGSCQSREQMDAKDDVPEVVAHLATIYADHPDYRDEWRP